MYSYFLTKKPKFVFFNMFLEENDKRKDIFGIFGFAIDYLVVYQNNNRLSIENHAIQFELLHESSKKKKYLQ